MPCINRCIQCMLNVLKECTLILDAGSGTVYKYKLQKKVNFLVVRPIRGKYENLDLREYNTYKKVNRNKLAKKILLKLAQN